MNDSVQNFKMIEKRSKNAKSKSFVILKDGTIDNPIDGSNNVRMTRYRNRSISNRVVTSPDWAEIPLPVSTPPTTTEFLSLHYHNTTYHH